MMVIVKDEKGSVLILTIFLLPLVLGFIGISIDVGYLMYQKAQLDASTEAAGRSTILLAYDRDVWNFQKKVIINEELAKEKASLMLKDNFENAELDELTVLGDSKIKVETSVEVKFFFMKIFGFSSIKINTHQIFSGG